MVIRNKSCFLVKGSGQTFTTEPNNLKGRNSYRYNGLVRQRTIGIEPASDGKGVVLVTKKKSGYRKPVKRDNRVELKSVPEPPSTPSANPSARDATAKTSRWPPSAKPVPSSRARNLSCHAKSVERKNKYINSGNN